MCIRDRQGALRYLSGKKLVRSESEILRRIGDRTMRMASLAGSAEEAMAYAETKRRSAPLQHDVLKLLCTMGSSVSYTHLRAVLHAMEHYASPGRGGYPAAMAAADAVYPVSYTHLDVYKRQRLRRRLT